MVIWMPCGCQMSATKKPRQKKYVYLSVVQGNYGYGWDDLYESEDSRDARARLKEYRANERGHSHRMIQRREPVGGKRS